MSATFEVGSILSGFVFSSLSDFIGLCINDFEVFAFLLVGVVSCFAGQ